MVDNVYVEHNNMQTITARTFTAEEIREINYYVKVNVPSTMLNQLLALTDSPKEKAVIFIAIYRIMNNAKNSVATKHTYIKLKTLLKETENTYYKTLELLQKLNGIVMGFQKRSHEYKINTLYLDSEVNEKVNRLIDIFLVFAEKQEMLDIDKTTGINLDTPEGKSVYKEIMGDLS